MHDQEHAQEGTLRQYIIGFVLSLILTMTAYFAVANELLTKELLTYFICTLGLVQSVVQLYYFLHLGSGKSPDWNMMVFLFMFSVLFIIVAGSLWIMVHLDYNMVPPLDLSLNLREQRVL